MALALTGHPSYMYYKTQGVALGYVLDAPSGRTSHRSFGSLVRSDIRHRSFGSLVRSDIRHRSFGSPCSFGYTPPFVRFPRSFGYTPPFVPPFSFGFAIRTNRSSSCVNSYTIANIIVKCNENSRFCVRIPFKFVVKVYLYHCGLSLNLHEQVRTSLFCHYLPVTASDVAILLPA